MARRFPTPWREEKFSGGYVVRDANGQALAYLYARSTESEAVEAKQLTFDEARGSRSTSRSCRSYSEIERATNIAVSLLEAKG